MPQRVLIADDSAVVRHALVRRVKDAGFEVVEHASCASAVSVDATTLCCALLDYDLGDGTGLDVATHLRDARATLPIAFFTSTPADVAPQAAGLGPVFAKPSDLDAAIEWIEHQARR